VVDVSYITNRTYGVLKNFMGAEYPLFYGGSAPVFKKARISIGRKTS
jgi:hypothetical protein